MSGMGTGLAGGAVAVAETGGELESTFPTGERSQDIQLISDWLVAEALGDIRLPSLLRGFCENLNLAGVPLLRAHVAMSALHPMYEARTFTWERGEEDICNDIPHGSKDAEGWQRSPLKPVLESGATERRYSLTDDAALSEFPLLAELKASGATEYCAVMTCFGHREREPGRYDGLMSAWATDAPGGFSDDDIAALRRLVPRFALAAKMAKREETALNVVMAYLGRDAGYRVLDGQIKLGDGEVIPSVIWMSDMRGSTALCDALSHGDYLEALNQYFACSAGAVLEAGGEVLRFVGDAVLGIFPIGHGGFSVEDACRAAIRAANLAGCNLAATNGRRRAMEQPEVDFGLGLHIGEVMYGNIGIPERVEFSVTGPAANEVARIEGLTKEVGERVLVSGAFARHLDLDWRPFGTHILKGVATSQEVFAPPPSAC